MTTVEDILMNKGPDVTIAPPSATVFQAARLMAAANVGSLIVKEGQEMLGIFTERDLLLRVVARGKDPRQTPLTEAMSSPVKTCRLNDSIMDVAGRMSHERIRHLAVVEDAALIGMVSVRDVLAAQLHGRPQVS